MRHVHGHACISEAMAYSWACITYCFKACSWTSLIISEAIPLQGIIPEAILLRGMFRGHSYGHKCNTNGATPKELSVIEGRVGLEVSAMAANSSIIHTY